MATIISAADTETVTLTHTDWWLKDPQDSGLNTTVELLQSPGFQTTRPLRTGLFEAVGRSSPLVVRESVTPNRVMNLTLVFTTDADFEAVEALLEANRTLLLQDDDTGSWYVDIISEFPVALEETPNRTSGNGFRTVPLTLVETEKP